MKQVALLYCDSWPDSKSELHRCYVYIISCVYVQSHSTWTLQILFWYCNLYRVL